jgi:BT1 family
MDRLAGSLDNEMPNSNHESEHPDFTPRYASSFLTKRPRAISKARPVSTKDSPNTSEEFEAEQQQNRPNLPEQHSNSSSEILEESRREVSESERSVGSPMMYRVPESLSETEERQQYIWQNYVMIGLIALIQGTLDLCLLAYFYIYLYDHKASPGMLVVLQGAAALPWVCKPLFGLLADRVKFLGYNRKSYVFAISLLEFTMHTLIFQYKFGLAFVILCNVLQVACVVFRNVIAGSLLLAYR